MLLPVIFVFIGQISNGFCSFDCLCNYNIETAVYRSPDTSSSPVGFLYEFDCKPTVPNESAEGNFVPIQFQHMVGYIEQDIQVQQQICEGGLPPEDIVTTIAPTEVSASVTNIVSTVTNPPTSTAASSTTIKTTQKPTTVTSSQTITSTQTLTTTTQVPKTSTSTPKPTTITTTPTSTTTTKQTTTILQTTTPSKTTTTQITTATVTIPIQTTNTSSTTPSTKKPTTTTIMSTTPSTTTTMSEPITMTQRQTNTNKPATTTTTATSTTTTTASFTTSTLPITTTTTPIHTTTSTPQPSTTTTTTLPTTMSVPTTTTQRQTTTTQPETTTTRATSPTTTTASFTTSTLPITTTPTPIHTTTSTLQPSTTTTTPLPTTTTTPYDPWSASVDVNGTPFEYVGIGYNLINGNPEVSPDPGLFLDKRVLQFTGEKWNVKQATLSETTTCIPVETDHLVYGEKSLQAELKQFVQVSDTHPDTIKNAAFTNNSDFQIKEAELNRDFIYEDKIASCKYASVQYNLHQEASNEYMVTREFATAVCGLPLELTTAEEEQYWKFLDQWGTSVVISLEAGSRDMVRTTSSESSFYKHILSTNPGLLQESGAVDGYSSSWSLNEQGYLASPQPSNPRGSVTSTSLGSATDYVPIKVSVVPIHDFINHDFFQVALDTLAAEGICSDNLYGDGLNTLAKNVNSSLLKYGERYKQVISDSTVQFPVTWPKGTYGLMKTAKGCPGAGVIWQTGYRWYDSEDVNPKNDFTSGIEHYLAGEFGKNIQTEFCMKTSDVFSRFDTDWPEGQYCLLKKSSCPNGFKEGFIYWDDEDVSNGNDRGGTLPDGVYDSNTKIFYCCRSDGSPTIPISLPNDSVFVLIRYGTTCQTVHGMSWKDIYIRWDDDDTFNKDGRGGMHPYDDETNHNHKLHFCYYHTGDAVMIG